MKPKIGQRVKVREHPAKTDFSGMVIKNFPREKASWINGDNGADTKVEWKYLEEED